MFDAFPIDKRVAGEMGRMWTDALEGYPQEAIEAAIAEYVRTETRRPVPAAIIKLCRAAMPRPQLVQPAEEPREQRCTPDQARAILAEAGYTPRRFTEGDPQ